LIRSSRLLEAENSFTTGIEPFWGPSDHEDAQTLGVQAILLNDFPDVFLGTQGGYAEGRRSDTNASRRGDRGVVSVLPGICGAQTTCLRFCTMPPVKRRSVLPMMKPKRLDIWNL